MRKIIVRYRLSKEVEPVSVILEVDGEYLKDKDTCWMECSDQLYEIIGTHPRWMRIEGELLGVNELW